MFTPTSERMRRGTAVAALTLLVAACSQGGGNGAAPPDGGATSGTSAQVACAINGALNYTESCTVEKVAGADTAMLVIRHADGGFRRFDIISPDTLAEADGAVKATVLRSGSTVEVTIGSDRYRLAASLLGNAS